MNYSIVLKLTIVIGC